MSDTPSKQLFLICNSHIDPVWLWNWEEGLAGAQSHHIQRLRVNDLRIMNNSDGKA